MNAMQRFALLLILCLSTTLALTACDDDEGGDGGGDQDTADGTSGSDTSGVTTDTSGGTSGDTSGVTDPCAGKPTCTSEGARSCATGPERILQCSRDSAGCLVQQTASSCVGNETCVDNAGSPACVNPCASIAPADACTAQGTRRCAGDILQVCEANTNGCLVFRQQTDCSAQTGFTTCGEANNTPSCVCDDEDPAVCPPGDPCEGKTLCDEDALAGATCDDDNAVLTTCELDDAGCLVQTVETCADTDPDFTCLVVDDDDDFCGEPPPACVDACTAGSSTCNANTIWNCQVGGDGCTAYVAGQDCAATALLCEEAAGVAACVAPSGPLNESEPNDSCATADVVPVGGVIIASIDPADDIDFFMFTLTTLSEVTIRTSNAAGTACPGDTIMGLYDNVACTNEIAFDDDSGPGLCSQIVRTLPAGTYYVAVEDWDGTEEVPNYHLSVSATPVTVTCGNGVVEFGEACDDGNTLSNDGCAGDCSAVEAGYFCPTPGQLCQEAGAGNLCAAAIPAGPGTYTGNTSTAAGYTNNYGPYTCSVAGSGSGLGNDVVYAVTVQSGKRLSASVTGTGFDAVLVTSTDCANINGSCLIRRDATGSGGAESLSYDNTTGAAQTIFVIVDAFSATTSGGAYSLTIGVEDIPPPGQGNTCADAIPIGAGSFTGNSSTANGYNNNYGPYTCSVSGSGTAAGNDVVYAVTLENNQFLTVTYTGTAHDAVLVAATDCANINSTCLIRRDATFGNGTTETLTYGNTTGSAQTIFLIADAWSSTTVGGPYTLNVAISDIQCGNGILEPGEACDPGAADPGCASDCSSVTNGYFCPTPGQPCQVSGQGNTCDNALTVGPGTYTGNTSTAAGYTNNYGPYTCSVAGSGSGLGNDVVYAVTVQSGKRLSASVTGTGFDAVLVTSTDCANINGSCLIRRDATGSGGTESLFYDNTTGAEQTIFVIVDAFSATTSGGAYSLTIGVEDIPPPGQGNTCDQAIVVVPGTYVGNSSAANGYSNNYGPYTCSVAGSGGGLGNDVVYAITLQAGESVTAAYTSTAFDGVLVAATDCANINTSCTTRRDAAGNNGTETLTYANTTGAEQTIFIIADAFSATTPGGAYTLTLTTAQCGNGVVETGEACDQGAANGTNTGCTSACAVQFAWTCVNSPSPSVCTGPTDLGTLASGGSVVADYTEAVPAGQNIFYRITFSSDVVLSGTLNRAGTTGDPDLAFFSETGTLLSPSYTANGNESFTGRAFTAGTYIVRVNAWTALTGFTLTLNAQ